MKSTVPKDRVSRLLKGRLEARSQKISVSLDASSDEESHVKGISLDSPRFAGDLGEENILSYDNIYSPRNECNDEIESFAYLQLSKLSSSAKRRVCFLCGGISLSLMILLLVVLLSGGGGGEGGGRIGAACFIGNCGGGSGGGSTVEEILSKFPSLVPTAISTGSPAGSPAPTAASTISVGVQLRIEATEHPTSTDEALFLAAVEEAFDGMTIDAFAIRVDAADTSTSALLPKRRLPVIYWFAYFKVLSSGIDYDDVDDTAIRSSNLATQVTSLVQEPTFVDSISSAVLSVTTVEMISVEVSTRSSHPTFTPTMSPTPSPTLIPAPSPTRMPHPIPTRSSPPTFAPTPQRPSVFVALSALYHSTNGADWTAEHGWMNGTVPCGEAQW